MQGAHCDTQVGRSFKERGEGGPTHGSEPGPCAQPAHQGDMSCMERPKGRQDGCGGRWAAAAGGPREDGCKARAGTPQGGGVRGRSKPWQTGRMPRRGRRKQGQRPRKGGCVPRAGKVRIGKGRQEPGGGGETPAPRGRAAAAATLPGKPRRRAHTVQLHRGPASKAGSGERGAQVSQSNTSQSSLPRAPERGPRGCHRCPSRRSPPLPTPRRRQRRAAGRGGCGRAGYQPAAPSSGAPRCVCVLQRLGLVHRRLALGTTQRDRALQK